jgi:hypothetical protein
VTNFLGCTPDQCPDRYDDASPVAQAATMPPTYIANGTTEIVPLQQAHALDDALAARHITTELREVPGSRHAFGYTDTVWNDTMAFLARGLGVPEPEPIDFGGPPFSLGLGTVLGLVAVVAIVVAVVARVAEGRNRGRGA